MLVWLVPGLGPRKHSNSLVLHFPKLEDRKGMCLIVSHTYLEQIHLCPSLVSPLLLFWAQSLS